MDIEKPFKCTTCSQGFTNEDHLQVHRKRHEMSLNLGLVNGSTGPEHPEGFTDQTPTPTRFFRISEEVGFFQDIQNVNPFDEQFARAASVTPSSENQNFDFGFSTASTSANDTLNTPQVLGYSPATPLPLVAQVQNQNLLDIRNQQKIKIDHETVQEISMEMVISSSTDDVVYTEDESNTPIEEPVDTEVSISPELSSVNKKSELLERNRAAAVRSRQRRREWVTEIEAKSHHLASLLAQTQTELRQVRAENLSLRDELSRHSNCNVSRGTQSSQIGPKSPTTAFQPAILRSPKVIIVPKPLSVKDILHPLPPPPIEIKPKRGRPRRGQEKRASLMLPPSGPPLKLQKVQILPFVPLRPTQPSVIVLKKSVTPETITP